ncbi:MAG: hypothetical protein WKG03_02890 [Telluria sp.]
MNRRAPHVIARPAPPSNLFDSLYLTFMPAPDVLTWARGTFLTA